MVCATAPNRLTCGASAKPTPPENSALSRDSTGASAGSAREPAAREIGAPAAAVEFERHRHAELRALLVGSERCQHVGPEQFQRRRDGDLHAALVDVGQVLAADEGGPDSAGDARRLVTDDVWNADGELKTLGEPDREIHHRQRRLADAVALPAAHRQIDRHRARRHQVGVVDPRDRRGADHRRRCGRHRQRAAARRSALALAVVAVLGERRRW